MVVTVKGTDRRFYLHEVVKIKNLSDGGSNTAQGQPVRQTGIANIVQDLYKYEQDCSTMVDENGEPKVFYHNTNAEFTIFDSQRNGSNTDAGWLGDGFYFYGDKNESRGYGKHRMAVFLNVRDPYYATHEENNRLAEANDRDESIAFREEVESDGYDGVYYNGDLRQEAVVFYPNQIKSATDNIGTYDKNNNDTRFCHLEKNLFQQNTMRDN